MIKETRSIESIVKNRETNALKRIFRQECKKAGYEPSDSWRDFEVFKHGFLEGWNLKVLCDHIYNTIDIHRQIWDLKINSIVRF